MAFVDGQVLTADELNALAEKDYVDTKIASTTDYAKQAAIDVACFKKIITVNEITTPTQPTLYNLGEITTLDLTNIGDSGYEVIIMFDVGTTAVNITYPSSYKTIGEVDFSKTSTSYIISVLKNTIIAQEVLTVTAS